MVALLRYGSGMPHYRLARLQQSLGVPLAESTQWELLVPLFQAAQPIFDELLRQTAQGSVFHNDDTSMRILELLLHTFLVPYFFPNWRRADFGNRSGLRS
jgi:hypothetical protein